MPELQKRDAVVGEATSHPYHGSFAGAAARPPSDEDGSLSTRVDNLNAWDSPPSQSPVLVRRDEDRPPPAPFRSPTGDIMPSRNLHEGTQRAIAGTKGQEVLCSSGSEFSNPSFTSTPNLERVRDTLGLVHSPKHRKSAIALKSTLSTRPKGGQAVHFERKRSVSFGRAIIRSVETANKVEKSRARRSRLIPTSTASADAAAPSSAPRDNIIHESVPISSAYRPSTTSTSGLRHRRLLPLNDEAIPHIRPSQQATGSRQLCARSGQMVSPEDPPSSPPMIRNASNRISEYFVAPPGPDHALARRARASNVASSSSAKPVVPASRHECFGRLPTGVEVESGSFKLIRAELSGRGVSRGKLHLDQFSRM